MAHMSRNIFVLFLLCIVLLIIVGVAFPSYLSRRNVKLRSAFNSSVESFKSLSSEKLISESSEADKINTNENTFPSSNNGETMKINISHSTTDSLLMSKVKKRAKRQMSFDNGSELFDWNFNINVTRYSKANEGKSEDLNASVKRSGVTVYLESKEPKEIAFSEMQAAFKSVKSFFGDFFKVDFEDITNDTSEKKKVQYFTESQWVKPGHTAIDSFNDGTKAMSEQPNIEEDETNSISNSLQPSEQISSEIINKVKLEGGNDSSISTDREARIFFGLFNLRGKSNPKTTTEPEETLTADDMDRNIVVNENLPDPHETVFATVNSQQVSSIPNDSFRSETEGIIIEPNVKIEEKSDMPSVTQQEDCLSCNIDITENSILPNEQDSSKTTLEMTSKPIEHLADKTLRNLCMQILSNLKESRTPFNEEEKLFEDQLGSSQNFKIDGSNSLIPNEVEEPNTRIDDNFFDRSEESPTENTMLMGKQVRFLNFFGLGSGRSEIINEGNLIFEKEPDEPNFTNLPSVSDCEKFKDWNEEVVPKQNHTSDLNTTPKIQDLVFLEDNQNQVSKNMEGEINSDENKTSFTTEVSIDINKDQRDAMSENVNTEENNESSNEVVELEIDSKQIDQGSTEGKRDGRIFSFLNFGSGNGQDTDVTGRFFGSGMRSLDSDESDERNELGSGIPFQEKVSVDGGDAPEKDTYEDISDVSIKEQRFLGAFGIGGSGEGREIADGTDSADYNAHIDCKNDCSHRATEQPYKCNDDCYPEYYDVTNSSAEFSQIDGSEDDCEGNCNTSIVEMHKDIDILTSESIGLDSSLNSESFLLTKSPDKQENSYVDENHNQIPSRKITEILDFNYYSTEKIDYKQSTELSDIEHGTTEKKNRRFMGTIFLTGSGDGGLFGDDGGPINLVEEENAVVSDRNPRRRGRLDDTDFGDNFGIPQEPFDVTVENSKSPSNSQDLVPLTDGPKDSFVTDKSGTKGFTPVAFTPSPNITQIHPRSCSGARDCNHTLNERCITLDASSVCDCGRSFVRHKETGKCVAKRLVETSLKLPEESFDEDLRNPDSPRYKQMSEKSLETIYLLLNKTPNILRVVTDVNVAGFTLGSLIVNLNFVLAADKDNPSQNLKNMENELQKALRDKNVVRRASLNVKNATFQPLKAEVNLCKSSELNYCSKYADCLWNEDYPGGFLCKCKEHYLDVSSHSFYPGEICVAKCPATFCGSNGHCEPLGNDKRHCVCYGLYFGERCEYPGVVILGSVSVVALICLIIVFVLILKLRCRSTSYGRTPTFQRSETPGHAIANCRVSDAIALGESRVMKVSKLTQISTPVQEPPAIKITRPTLNESSIRFDCDSTFDVSKNSDEKTV